MSIFAETLTALMVERGMDKAALSRLTDIPYHRLNMWFIRENAKPSGADVQTLSIKMGVSERYLLTGEGDRTPLHDSDLDEAIARFPRLSREHKQVVLAVMRGFDQAPGSTPERPSDPDGEGDER